MTNGGWVFTNNITRVAIWIQFLCEVAANERVDIRPGLHIIDWPFSWSTNTPNFWGFSSRKRWVTGVVKASYLSLFLSPTYQYPFLGHRVNTKSFLLMDSLATSTLNLWVVREILCSASNHTCFLSSSMMRWRVAVSQSRVTATASSSAIYVFIVSSSWDTALSIHSLL